MQTSPKLEGGSSAGDIKSSWLECCIFFRRHTVHNDIAMVFVAIVAVAILMQAGILFAIFKALSRLNVEVREARQSFENTKEPLFSDLKSLIKQSVELVSNLNRMSGDFVKISSTARSQVEKFDGLVSETADMARQQVLRLDALVGSTIDQIEHTSRVVQDSILAPVREVSAVIKGVKTGLEFLTSKRRPTTVDKATQDEAMFI
jgi:methyl-accepting chemotaxis protein